MKSKFFNKKWQQKIAQFIIRYMFHANHLMSVQELYDKFIATKDCSRSISLKRFSTVMSLLTRLGALGSIKNTRPRLYFLNITYLNLPFL